MDNVFNEFLGLYASGGVIVWLWLEVLLFLIIIFLYKSFKNTAFMVFFEMLFEKVFEFFEDILWIEEKRWIKVYITTLFFIILFSNFLWVFLEFLLPIFGEELEHFVTIPSADLNFNVAMSLVGLAIILIEQFRALGMKKALYEYFPILGKDYIPYTRGILPKYIDLPVFLLIKLFDIFISLFLWILEIVGHWAKIISLSFRLFWNVTSGWILLWMLFTALSWATLGFLWFEFPVIGPIIVYLQEILVALIQALVFPLLIAIFIKVWKAH